MLTWKQTAAFAITCGTIGYLLGQLIKPAKAEDTPELQMPPELRLQCSKVVAFNNEFYTTVDKDCVHHLVMQKMQHLNSNVDGPDVPQAASPYDRPYKRHSNPTNNMGSNPFSTDPNGTW